MASRADAFRPAFQIRAELAHNNIRVYPFDTEENDAEERQLNQAIRVRYIPIHMVELANIF